MEIQTKKLLKVTRRKNRLCSLAQCSVFPSTCQYGLKLASNLQSVKTVSVCEAQLRVSSVDLLRSNTEVLTMHRVVEMRQLQVILRLPRL